MASLSLKSRLCHGARLLMPGPGRPSVGIKGRHVALAGNSCENGNKTGVANYDNGMNTLACQFSVLRLSSTFSSSSSTTTPFSSSSSAAFHSSSELDGAKLKPKKQPPVIRPLEELPEKPKQPQSAWLEFIAVNRPMIKRAQPSLSPTEVLKVLGEMWKRVNPTEKDKYEARARLRRKEFDRAMEKWKKETTEEERNALDVAKREEKLNKEKGEILAKQKREKKLLLEELGKPKKPMTTFFLYRNRKP